MTELTLSIFDPNTLLPHRAGIAGLALALSAIDPADAPLQWNVTEDAVTLSWESKDQEAMQWLLEQTYRSDQGYLETPALKLDEQGRYIFSEGVMNSFLQHSKQRTREKQAVPLNFTVEDDQPEIRIDYRPVMDCYYTRGVKDAFNSKGGFKKEISLKGHHLPGLVECFVNGAYAESPTGFLALLFLPLACAFYQLPGYRSALVIPEVCNIKEWAKLRLKMPGRTYGSFRSSSAGESALNFLLREKLADDSNLFRVEYCEVYRLGSQPWDGNQSYLKQAVHRVQVNDQVLGLYEVASRLLPPRVKLKQDGSGTWLAESKALAWISDNLIANKPWHNDFFEFRKANAIYPEDRRGLIVMTEHLSADERVLFDAVQGAFSAYLREQIQQAQKQGRPLDYGQVTDKVIYRLQRPGTQQQFTTALVKFLSDFRSGAARGNGLQIFAWLNQPGNWRTARDLALLAIATYQSKSKEEKEVLEQDSIEEAANVM
ncbi:type I-MYXAN CRISPR-associated Cas8a1/Cmx1 [Synechococcales cyanobacterium C]|uniref:Type I-MYXAN CRISPR-associated Cas8a1/Cmx1 n=1 Tax=Petrachloros mirabilis ULC683 TaxID=2781853 RepID=A0A8K1ZY30_9CYAN|nr:type I-MYXAN CRISPR-associated Cas8a1/Cmx1 [Petrachloros mirabilis]NCJ06223.1 type I-MYXAN CRISPR-associated Cas8a1/Cmx1 [Petrachloros mirabilis ULC683]